MNCAKKIFSQSPKLSSLSAGRKIVGSTTCDARCLSSVIEDAPSCKLVVFDKDGTLTCFSSMWGPWCEVTASRLENASGRRLSDDIFDFFNYNKTTKKVGKSSLAHDTHEVLKENVTNLLVNQHGIIPAEAKSLVSSNWIDNFDISEISVTETIQPLANVKKIFTTLKEKGIKIAVCTSDSREGAEIALESLGVSSMVDRLVCGDDTDNTSKPAPDNIHLICEDLGVDPEETAMIGDTHFDTVMGRNSNCGAVIGVLSGQGELRDLEDADYVVKSIEEALPIILDKFPANNAPGAQPSMTPYRPATFSSRMYSTSSIFQSSAKDKQAKRSFSTSSSLDKEYTHIVVGAGSAGCVLANRLSEDSSNSVLLIEAGPKDTILNSFRLLWKIHMPAALTYNLCDDKYNWFYHTTPQKNVDNRVMYWPRGRVWGGSSSLNAMVYIRGHAYDYDRWQKEGAKDWDYDHCLPYFRKAQNHELGGDTYRGGDGPLNVSQGDVSGPLCQAFIEAGQQAGYPYTPDMNGYQQEGVGPMDMTIHKGYRWSAASAYLRPVLSRPNLHTEIKCLTTKISFEGNKAVGIEVIQNNEKKEFRASKEVILSGGAINSPQLLMLSGVGNADDLKELGIPVIQHLPGVGQNLQDHLELYVQHRCKKPITLYSAQQPVNMIRIGAEWLLKQTGLGASAHLHAGGFIRSKTGITHPDIQYHFLPSQVIDHGRVNPECEAFQVHVGTLRETSRGWLKLQSRDPKEHPIIEPNYLSTENDIVDLRQCMKLTREIMQQKAFDELRGEELRPGVEFQSDSEIDAFVRAKCDSAYHPSCTCKMGDESDPMAVVSNEARVFGLENLRVVDASIMPSVASGNLNAPTIMIAEKVADMIRGREPLHLPSTPVYQPESLSMQR